MGKNKNSDVEHNVENKNKDIGYIVVNGSIYVYRVKCLNKETNEAELYLYLNPFTLVNGEVFDIIIVEKWLDVDVDEVFIKQTEQDIKNWFTINKKLLKYPPLGKYRQRVLNLEIEENEKFILLMSGLKKVNIKKIHNGLLIKEIKDLVKHYCSFSDRIPDKKLFDSEVNILNTICENLFEQKQSRYIQNVISKKKQSYDFAMSGLEMELSELDNLKTELYNKLEKIY